LTLSEQQYSVWYTASQSTKRLDMLEIEVMALPWLRHTSSQASCTTSMLLVFRHSLAARYFFLVFFAKKTVLKYEPFCWWRKNSTFYVWTILLL